jgi:uncharacterized protein
MRLEHYSLEKLQKELLSIIGRHVDLSRYRVFFFGSRVNGTGTERSDIDVGIEGPDGIPGHVIGTIQEELSQLPLLYKIDIVDFSHVTNTFKEVVGNKREYIS